MSSQASTALSVTRDQPLRAIGLKLLSVAVFVAMQGFIKSAGDLPAGQIVFFRSFFALLPLIVFMSAQGVLGSAWKTKRPVSHFLRGVVGTLAMAFSFLALTRLPLPEAITLNYAQPLLVVIFSAVFLGESVRLFRWTAVMVGLVGVVIVSWPKLTLLGGGMGDREFQGVLAAFAGAAASAVAMLLIRNLVQTERSTTIVLWFSLSASLLSLLTIPFGWQPLSGGQAALLILAGCCGGIAQVLMTEAYRYAEASTVAPFEYSSLLLGLIVGYFIFNEAPTLHMVIGGLIVVASGLFILWRERRLGLDRASAKKVAPPQ